MLNFLKRKTNMPQITQEVKADISKPDRDLSKLYPPFKEMIDKLLVECHSKGVMLYVFEAFRSMERQALLYSQGRTAPGKIITNADKGLSFHNYGIAVDLVFDGKPGLPGIQWDWGVDYKPFGEIVKAHKNLEWAGTWKRMREAPHVQLKLAYSAVQLKALYDEHKSISKMWEIFDAEFKNKSPSVSRR